MAWVIIPAYQLGKELISIAEEMWECGCRLLVVDDGSGEEYEASLSSDSVRVLLAFIFNQV